MGEIKLDAHNYRIHDDKNLKLIKRSLKKLGAGRSILIDADGVIIAGNATYQTAQELGIPVETIKIDGSKVVALQRTDLHTQDKERKEMALMDNTTSANPNYDYGEIQTDFSADELPSLGIDDIPTLVEDNAEIVEDEVPEQVETKCKRGDIWQLGDHRLMCGDSTVITDVIKLMNGDDADLLFTDPPYNVAFNGRSGKFDVIKNDNLTGAEFKEFIHAFLSVLKIISPTTYYICCNWAFYGILQLELKPKACIVWAKNVFGLGKGYRHQHEFILFDGFIDGSITDESDLWQIKKDVNYKHPTQKPVALSARAIKNSSKSGQIVLDLFGGSGSTLIACEQLKRKCRMMELDPHYCDVIIKRWENLTGKKAVLCK